MNLIKKSMAFTVILANLFGIITAANPSVGKNNSNDEQDKKEAVKTLTTPLHLAVMSGNADLVNALLSASSNIYASKNFTEPKNDKKSQASSSDKKGQPSDKKLVMNVGVAQTAKEWPKSKEYIEDFYSFNSNYEPYFFGIFDGHGGNESAEHTSKKLYSNITKLQNFPSVEAICDGFLITDNQIKDKKTDAGCTAATAFIINNKIYLAHTGDSRILLSKNGTVVWSSVDHDPTNEKEQVRIYQAGGKISDSRLDGVLAVSRALGDYFEKDEKPKGLIATPDIAEFDLDGSFDCMILASDGIFDNLISGKEADATTRNKEVAALVYKSLAKTKSAQDAAQALIKQVKATDKARYMHFAQYPHDDLTAMVVTFTWL